MSFTLENFLAVKPTILFTDALYFKAREAKTSVPGLTSPPSQPVHWTVSTTPPESPEKQFQEMAPITVIGSETTSPISNENPFARDLSVLLPKPGGNKYMGGFGAQQHHMNLDTLAAHAAQPYKHTYGAGAGVPSAGVYKTPFHRRDESSADTVTSYSSTPGVTIFSTCGSASGDSPSPISIHEPITLGFPERAKGLPDAHFMKLLNDQLAKSSLNNSPRQIAGGGKGLFVNAAPSAASAGSGSTTVKAVSPPGFGPLLTKRAGASSFTSRKAGSTTGSIDLFETKSISSLIGDTTSVFEPTRTSGSGADVSATVAQAAPYIQAQHSVDVPADLGTGVGSTSALAPYQLQQIAVYCQATWPKVSSAIAHAFPANIGSRDRVCPYVPRSLEAYIEHVTDSTVLKLTSAAAAAATAAAGGAQPSAIFPGGFAPDAHAFLSTLDGARPSRSRVFAAETIWCARPFARHAEAGWPCAEEFKWEGDSRISTERGIFRRMLPLPRVSVRDPRYNPDYRVRPRNVVHAFDDLWPIPTVEDVLYLKWQVPAEQEAEFLGEELVAAIDADSL